MGDLSPSARLCVVTWRMGGAVLWRRRECLGGSRRTAWRGEWTTWLWGSTSSSSRTPLASSISRYYRPRQTWNPRALFRASCLSSSLRIAWQVVLLGRYNGQGLEDVVSSDLVSYVRTLSGESPTFVRVTLLRGRMVRRSNGDAPTAMLMMLC